MANVIKAHNTKILGQTSPTGASGQGKLCNCRGTAYCPLAGKCQVSSIVYKATVISLSFFHPLSLSLSLCLTPTVSPSLRSSLSLSLSLSLSNTRAHFLSLSLDIVSEHAVSRTIGQTPGYQSCIILHRGNVLASQPISDSATGHRGPRASDWDRQLGKHSIWNYQIPGKTG